jgi:diaminopimelate dehydrogenase
MNSEQTRIAIVGYGNVGRGVIEAINRNPDMNFAGIISRRPEEMKANFLASQIYTPDDFRGLKADVAILCGGSATDLPTQGPFYARHFNTVDSFDTHADIAKYDTDMHLASVSNEHTAVISAGWDPGTFSLERVLGNAFVPGSKAYTFWGKGVSQGHSQAIRSVDGVLNGIQYTVPSQQALDEVRAGNNPELTTRQKHTRECFIALKPGADEDQVRKTIVEMPKYFSDYDTTVTIESPEQVAERLKAMPHGGFVMTSGKTGKDNKALIEYRNQWASNPEATGSILVACARACVRLNNEGKFGPHTMLDIPPAYYTQNSREELLKHWM